jgi:hypothetical protein
MKPAIGIATIALSTALIAGCQSPETKSEPASGAPAGDVQPGPQTRSGTDSPCGVDKVRRFMNVLLTQPVEAQIAQAAGQRPIRYIHPGDRVTMDFVAERLDVHLGPDGKIVNLRCG